jgi:hypothetical protein
MGSKSVNITPDIRLLETIGEANYTIPEAIGELIANCFDARLRDTKMVIDVVVSADEISITDNGTGMSSQILGESLRLAVEMDKVKGNTQPRKGTYGLGMKAACSSLGKNWGIYTRPEASKDFYYLEIDLKKWNGQKDRGLWQITIHDEKWIKSNPYIGGISHGTKIVITNLKDKNPIVSAIVAQLGMAYKPHLEHGDVIRVNGNAVMPKAYDLIENKKYPIDTTVDGHKITGWFGLDIKTHNDNFYGINIYKENQLVESWNKDFIRAHLMNSRVVGEVNSTIFQANFHKKGLQKNTDQWKSVKAVMAEILKPAMKASGDMAKNKNDGTRQAKAMQALEGALGNATVAVSGSQEIDGTEDVSENQKAKKDKVEVSGSHTSLLIGDDEITISYFFAEVNDSELPWGYIFDEEKNDLQAIVNIESDIWKSIKDEKLLGILAAAEAVVAFLIEHRGYKFGTAWEIRNKWLTMSLKNGLKKIEGESKANV